MTNRPDDDEGLFGEDTSESIAERSPRLRGAVLVFAPERRRRESVVAALADDVDAEPITDEAGFLDALTADVAVVLLSMRLPEETLRTAALRTIKDTSYARIGLLARNHEQVAETLVPHDEIFYRSSDRRTFRNRVRRLYVRAYYDAALQRYYSLSVATQNRQAATDDEDEQLGKLTKSTELMEGHLQQFRQYLQPGDLEAILSRSEHIEGMVTALLEGDDPTVVGLPRACPDCGLAWGEWHGSELESGYVKIGAETWRCTQCGTVIGGNDPDNYRVS